MTPEHRRAAVTDALHTAVLSDRQACRYTGFGRSTSPRYRTRRPSWVESRAQRTIVCDNDPEFCGEANKNITSIIHIAPGEEIFRCNFGGQVNTTVFFSRLRAFQVDHLYEPPEEILVGEPSALRIPDVVSAKSDVPEQ